MSIAYCRCLSAIDVSTAIANGNGFPANNKTRPTKQLNIFFNFIELLEINEKLSTDLILLLLVKYLYFEIVKAAKIFTSTTQILHAFPLQIL